MCTFFKKSAQYLLTYRILIKITINSILKNRIMIAVFCRNENYFVELGCSPKNQFKRIEGISDIIGRNFTGVILMSRWYDNNKLHDAHDILKIRQPELFNQ